MRINKFVLSIWYEKSWNPYGTKGESYVVYLTCTTLINPMAWVYSQEAFLW